MTPPPRVPRKPNEIEKALKRQVDRLRARCADYDNGDEFAAEEIALKLRVLLHHQGRSKALLMQVGIQDTALFHDVIGPCPPPREGKNMLIRFGAGGLRFGKAGPHYAAELGPPIRKVPFAEWWEDPLIVRSEDNIRLSRRDIVLEVANTDGGGHVDPEIVEGYAKVIRDEAYIGEIHHFGRGELRPSNNPVFASLRQIAHEVIGTIEENAPHLL